MGAGAGSGRILGAGAGAGRILGAGAGKSLSSDSGRILNAEATVEVRVPLMAVL
jgi:hypothetical protein